MSKRYETRVVDTGGAALTTTIQENPCEVCFITVSAQALATQGLIQIFDGFDASGRPIWQLEPGYSRQNIFHHHLPCSTALTVYNDANIASYTIQYAIKRHERLQE